jgi:hypothetical protein
MDCACDGLDPGPRNCRRAACSDRVTPGPSTALGRGGYLALPVGSPDRLVRRPLRERPVADAALTGAKPPALRERCRADRPVRRHALWSLPQAALPSRGRGRAGRPSGTVRSEPESSERSVRDAVQADAAVEHAAGVDAALKHVRQQLVEIRADRRRAAADRDVPKNAGSAPGIAVCCDEFRQHWAKHEPARQPRRHDGRRAEGAGELTRSPARVRLQ